MKLKTIRVILSIVLLISMLFFLFKFFEYHGAGKVETTETFSEAKILYGNEDCYAIKEHLYVINTETGTIHIFNKNGEFEQGIQLPTNGGSMWIGIKNKLYTYCIRTNLLTEIENISLNQKNVYYDSPQTFRDSLNLAEKNPLVLKKNKVQLIEGNQISEVVLNIKTTVLSAGICILLYAICFFCFLTTTGVFKKFKKQE